MTDQEPTDAKNLDRYGNPSLPWERAHSVLAANQAQPGNPYFLGTVTTSGRPHSAGVGALWFEGDLYFTCGPGTRKAHNLAANPASTISVGLPGIDLVLEGEASKVSDTSTLEKVAALYCADGWMVEVQGDALTGDFNAPSAGPPPWPLYRFTYSTVFGVATTEPYGATRWRFGD